MEPAIRPPIIVDESGDISIFDSARSAERYLEPIDVRNEVYEVYDATGRRLKPEIRAETRLFFGRFGFKTESVVLVSSELVEADRLQQRLLRFLEKVKKGDASLAALPLETLVEELRHRVGTTS